MAEEPPGEVIVRTFPLPIAVQMTRRSGVLQCRIQNEVRGVEPASILATNGTYLPINKVYLSVSGVYSKQYPAHSL